LLDKYAVDLGITDLVMPGLDGFSLVTRIRQKLPAVPIVIISGYTAQFAAPALNEATEFLPKPIDPKTTIRGLAFLWYLFTMARRGLCGAASHAKHE
jgi:YesN/AraC family two-component response regulator